MMGASIRSIILVFTTTLIVYFTCFYSINPDYMSMSLQDKYDPEIAWKNQDMLELGVIELMKQGQSWRQAENNIAQLPPTHEPSSSEIRILSGLYILYESQKTATFSNMVNAFPKTTCEDFQANKLISTGASIKLKSSNIFKCDEHIGQKKYIIDVILTDVCITSPDVISVFGPSSFDMNPFVIKKDKIKMIYYKNGTTFTIEQPSDNKHHNIKNYISCYNRIIMRHDT